MPISGGSSLEFENKKQRRNYFRQVHSIMVDGPIQKTQWSHMPIVFSEEDVNLLSFPHTDALVIEANIQGWTIGKILVDTGSSADIIFSSTFDRMNIDRNLLQPADIPLIGFGGKRVNALGKITLPVSFGDLSNPRTESVTFNVVEMNYPYNAIFGRGIINKFEAIVHQLYLCMKMPAIKGVITVRGNQQLARDIERGVAPGQRNVHLVEADKKPPTFKEPKRDKEETFQQECKVKKVPLDKLVPDRQVTISAALEPEEECELLEFLNKNKDVFAWSANDLRGVSRDIIEHKLDIDPKIKPKKQKLRKMSDDKVAAVKAEVQRLLDAKVIREVKYPTWLANTVPVKKKNGKWRMCIDFTDLNKACPKDDFPLPRIDKVVDDASNSQLMSLLDCFSGYHQIWMNREDEEKTSFTTPFGTYCFVRMPEGLKNAGQSFSRMSSKVLGHQLRKNVLTYVDDIVVTSTERKKHVADLAETFASLRRANLSLNPEKCVFGIDKGKVLGCLVSTKGIEANPDKVKALQSMEEPQSVRDVQKLTGRIAALNRFIPRSADRSSPFFKTLRSSSKFEWGEEQKKAFRELKNYLENLTKMTSPNPEETLLLYTSASQTAVSAALVVERTVEGRQK